MKRLFLVAALLASGAARAADDAPPPETSGSSSFYEGKHFGLQLDAGAPAGASLALVGRPWSFLRVNGGLGYNIIGYGIKGGLAFIPFHGAVRPTLGLEAGHFFEADASRFVSGASQATKDVLRHVGYDYLSADLGLEMGSEEGFTFYIRAGLANLYGSVAQKDVNAALVDSNPGLRMAVGGDATARGRVPALRLGFIWYLF